VQADEINLFPIPAKRFIQIENNAPIENAILYTLDGKRLRSPLFDVAEKKLFFNGVASGVYLLKLTISGREIVKKVTVE
jgi:chaperone required for assembly of F1-ATPase